MLAGQKSNDCSEGCSSPAVDNYLCFRDNITYCSEGADKMVLIEHHIKYKEIHGTDETVWMEKSKHQMLHRRLRQDGKCNIPSKELNEISMRAFSRTSKALKKSSLYHQRTRKSLNFYQPLDKFVYLQEMISYNQKTGNISITVSFKASNHKELFIIYGD